MECSYAVCNEINMSQVILVTTGSDASDALSRFFQQVSPGKSVPLKLVHCYSARLDVVQGLCTVVATARAGETYLLSTESLEVVISGVSRLWD